MAVSVSLVALLALGVVLKVMAGVFTQVTIALFAMFLVNPAVNRAASLIDRLIRRVLPGTGRRPRGARNKTHAAEVMGS
jgi:predicted PurR-regulated permease PerM